MQYNKSKTKNSDKNGYGSYPLVEAASVVPLPCPVPDSDEMMNLTEMQQNHERNPERTVEANRILNQQGYTEGLIESIHRNNDVFEIRYWVVDNSGSMNTMDGHRLEPLPNNALKVLSCSRWAEIQDTVTYHAQIAAALAAPTSFRLLNPARDGTEMFGVAENGPERIRDDLNHFVRTIREISPDGVTPLSERVREIGATIESMRDRMVAEGGKAVVVLATDGLPSDRNGSSDKAQLNEFTEALRSLEGLPVWVVIRLCTDDDRVVDYYNNLDNDLELSIDVLDDFVTEAKEVYRYNPWLNYALPLHRMREMGFYHKLFDLLDERSLTKDELRDFFRLLYGVDSDALDGLPDPQVDWDKFVDCIDRETSKAGLQWNPITKRMTPWIDIGKLDRKYGNKFKCLSLLPILL